MKKFKILLAFVLPATILVFSLNSCKKKPDSNAKAILQLPSTPYDYSLAKEEGKMVPIQLKIKDESGASFSNATATLGRVLFYDKNLSINNNIACGSCHHQDKAFSDGVAASKGFAHQTTPRNSMAILNVADNNNMFWDSRSKSPMALSLEPVFNHLEMGMESDEMLVSKLQAIDYYGPLFQSAFGSTEVTKETISKALTNFLNAVYSKDSKFDREKENNFSGFNTLETMGKNLFESDRLMCNSCHNISSNFAAPDFPGGAYGGGGGRMTTHNSFVDPNDPRLQTNGFNNPNDPKGTTNIGLDLVYKDNGFGQGQFKIPSLRNIAITGPYMHDGRFATLSDVIDHYSHGIQNHPNLDPKFRFNGKAKKLNITEHEKTALMAFLNTLTDQNLLTDPKFADPFVLK